jgi:hypothetical protein
MAAAKKPAAPPPPSSTTRTENTKFALLDDEDAPKARVKPQPPPKPGMALGEDAPEPTLLTDLSGQTPVESPEMGEEPSLISDLAELSEDAGDAAEDVLEVGLPDETPEEETPPVPPRPVKKAG